MLTADRMIETSRLVFQDVWNAKQYNAMSRYMVKNVQIVHDSDEKTLTIDETLIPIKRYHEAIPDLTIKIEDQLVDRDARAVVNLLALTGTQVDDLYDDINAGGMVWMNRVIVHWFNDEGKIFRVRSIHSRLRKLANSH